MSILNKDSQPRDCQDKLLVTPGSPTDSLTLSMILTFKIRNSIDSVGFFEELSEILNIKVLLYAWHFINSQEIAAMLLTIITYYNKA